MSEGGKFLVTLWITPPAGSTPTKGEVQKFVEGALDGASSGFGPDNPFYGFTGNGEGENELEISEVWGPVG